MIVGTAGHIDHGKTTLTRALTGVDTDRLKEEKARGISIELGYAYTPLPNGDVLGYIDVPGHERFVHTMVAGATAGAAAGNLSMGNVSMDQIRLAPNRTSAFMSNWQNDISGNTFSSNMLTGRTAARVFSRSPLRSPVRSGRRRRSCIG
mgnify:CR=1 FL=1